MRTYINQEYLINKISESSIYEKEEIQEIFNILEDIILDTLLTKKNTEIRLLSGLKIHSKFLKPDLVKSNLSSDGFHQRSCQYNRERGERGQRAAVDSETAASAA